MSSHGWMIVEESQGKVVERNLVSFYLFDFIWFEILWQSSIGKELDDNENFKHNETEWQVKPCIWNSLE